MTQRSTPDDLVAVRSLLGPANPVPDPGVAREDVLSARASVGLARAASPRPTRVGGRLVAAGAVALLSVATLVALVSMPADDGPDSVALVTGPGARAVSSAYAATAGAGTARGLLTITSGGRTLTASGVGSFEGGAAHVEVGVPGDTGGSPSTITVIRTTDTTYARLPEGTNPLASDKPWVSVDATTLAQLAQLALGDIGSQLTGAPLDALAYLKGVSGDVQLVGPDTTRGEATTRYRGTVDPLRVVEQLPAALRPEAGRAVGPGGRALPADLWIDGAGRLRKLVLTAEVPPAEGAPPGSAGTATAVVELWDFGVTVDAVPPPADQVVDVGGLLSGFLGGARRP